MSRLPTISSSADLQSIPLAAPFRRQARASELSRVVPECCGLVWYAVRAQHTKAGRHVAVYWDESIRLEVGVELEGPFSEAGDVVRSATPSGTVAWVTHLGPYNALRAAHQACTRLGESRESSSCGSEGGD